MAFRGQDPEMLDFTTWQIILLGKELSQVPSDLPDIHGEEK